MDTSNGIEIYLFREFELHPSPPDASRTIGSKGAELLAFLLLNHERPYRREQLMALLWPETPERRARRNLRQTLWQLRRGLALITRSSAESIFYSDSVNLGIDPGAACRWDVRTFRHAADRVLPLRPRAVSDNQMAILDEAVDLYRGDLLEGWDQLWCWIEREELRALHLRMLDRLVELSALRGQFDRGFEYGYRALRVDAASERTYRRLMRLSASRGDRSGALRFYVQCREALWQELGVEPDHATRSLATQIRDGDVSRARSRTASDLPLLDHDPLLAPVQPGA